MFSKVHFRNGLKKKKERKKEKQRILFRHNIKHIKNLDFLLSSRATPHCTLSYNRSYGSNLEEEK